MASALLNPTDHQGLCPTPFLAQETFPNTGGFLPGRFCMPVEALGNASCCLPCPITDWTYADGFNQRAEAANWVNVVAFIFSLFLLLSFTILPVKWTHRHYLGICLTVGIILMELAFVIPLIAQPDQCFNAITPNDMKSSGICAISGALLLFGGWAVISWIFVRALSLHLQICWEVVPGKRFFFTSLVLGWGIPVAVIATTLSLSSVSFRFGSTCHINHKDALQDFWGPLLAVAALALVLQFITLGYCIQVYLKTLFDDKNTTNSSSLPAYSGSLVAASARQTYKRVKRVVELQWRGACIVLLIIGEVVFFSVVFVSMDNSAQMNATLLKKATPWITCLALTGGDKNRCLPLASGLVKKEGIVLAVLICLGLSGFWCLLFLGRWSMVLGWRDLFRRRMIPNHEFVSADARRMSNDPRTYEMLSSTTPQLNIKSPERVVVSPGPDPRLQAASPFQSPDEPDSKQEYFGKGSTRTYVTSPTGYPLPTRTLSANRAGDWDPQSTHAKSGLTALPRKSLEG